MIVSYLLFAASFQAYALGPATPANLDLECQKFISSIDADYYYKWIDVPETPNSSEMITVFYYYRKAASFKNPVIFFNGGPGYTSHSSADGLEKAKAKLGGNAGLDIDFILMDQRGSGCSTRFPIGASPQAIEKLVWYGSSGIVNDAEAIRKALIGDRKWKVFGQSFGGHVVHRYLKMYPQAISSAHAHGFTEGRSDFDFSYSRVVAEDSVLKSYLKRYPDDGLRLNGLTRLVSDPKKCYLNAASLEICGYEISAPLFVLLGFRDQWESLHLWLAYMVPASLAVEENVNDYVQKFITSAFVLHKISDIDESYFAQVSVALNFIGLIDSNSTPMDAIKCAAIYKKIESVNKVKQENLLFDPCKAPVQFNYYDQLGSILKSRIPDSDVDFIKLDDIKVNLLSYKIPFFLYSGGMDSLVPKDLFQTEVKFLGSLVRYTNFPGSGHDGYYTESQVLLDLMK